MKVARQAAQIIGAVATVASFIPGPWQMPARILATAAAVFTTVTAKAPKPSAMGTPTTFQANPQAPVPYIMGRFGTAGWIVHREAFGATLNEVENPYQAFVIVWSGGGPVHEIESFKVDRTTVAFDGSGNVTTSTYRRDAKVPGGGTESDAPFMWLRTKLGACPEAAALTSPVPYSVPGWTSSSKLSGYCHGLWVLRFDKNAKLYMAGVPLPTAVIKGVKVYDPRLDSTYPGGSGSCRALQENTYVYSDNPWLHELTWALGRWQNSKRVLGVGLPVAGIDVAAMVEGANIADANVWKIGGQVTSADDKWNVLKMIAQAGGGMPIRLGALLSCLVDAPRVSLATISSSDLVERGSVVATQPQRDRINGIIPRIPSEAHGWEVIPLDPVRPSTYVTEDGEDRTREVDYQLVPYKDQAAELAAYQVCNSREFGPITLPLKPVFIGYKPGDCLTINIPELGLVNQKAIVINRSLDPVSGVVTLEFRSETEAKHDFALGRTGTAPPTPSLTPLDLTNVPQPYAGDWDATGGTVSSSTGAMPAIIVEGQVTYATVDEVIFEYRKDGETEADWRLGGTDNPTVTRKEITGLPPADAYEVAVSYVVRGIVGPRLVLGPVTTGNWTVLDAIVGDLTNDSHTVAADAAGTVSSFAGSGGTFNVYHGQTDVTASATFSVVSSTGVTISINSSGVYSISAMSADHGTATLRAVYAGVTLNKIYSISKSRAGATGSTGSTGATGPGGPVLALTATEEAFKFTDGVADNSSQSITITVALQNTSETVNWSTSPSVTLTGSGSSRSLSIANFGTNKEVVVTATGATSGVSDKVSLVRLERSTAAANAGTTLTLSAIGTAGTTIVGNSIKRNSGHLNHDAAAVGLPLVNSAFAFMDIVPGQWHTVALDIDNTDFSAGGQAYRLDFTSGNVLQLVVAGSVVWSETVAHTGAFGLAYNGSEVLVIAGSSFRQVYTTGVTAGQTYYPKFWAIDQNITYKNLQAGHYSEHVGPNLPDVRLPAQITIQANSNGATTTPLPQTVRVSVFLNGVDISSTTGFSVSLPSGVTGSINNTGGSADRGLITLTAVDAAGNIEVTVTVTGYPDQKYNIAIVRPQSAPPTSSSGGDGSSGGTASNDITLTEGSGTALTSSTNVQIGSIKKVKSSAGGVIKYSGSMQVGVAPPNTGTFGLTAQRATLIGGPWTDFEAERTDNSEYHTGYGQAIPAHILYQPEASETGLTASTDYFVRLVARKISGSNGTIENLSFRFHNG